MLLLAFNLTLVEIIVLQLGAIVLGIAIYFFWSSNKALSETLRQSKGKLNLPSPAKKTFLQKIGLSNIALELDLPEPKKSSLPQKQAIESIIRKPQPTQAPSEPFDNMTLASLKDALLRQQQMLNTLMTKIERVDTTPFDKKGLLAEKEELEYEKEELEKKVEQLELLLDDRDSELKRIKQQEVVAQQMASRIDEVYKEFDILQQKITSLEKQANKANELALELEDEKHATEQLRREVERKQEKLEEMIAENQRLHTALSTTEDKLAEANIQRQQLQKKVQFLQDINNDMQHVSESNQRLQNELRRIGELESMLSMIAEERDRLLKKGNKE
jgi:chromosome segregation ATPase